MAISLEQRLNAVASYLQSTLRLMAPYRTGNLANNGITVVQVAPNHYQIIIGNEVVPYAIWTNVEWIPENHGGNSNPNQGWVQGVIRLCEPMIRQIMSGEIPLEDVQAVITQNEAAFQQQVDYLSELKAPNGLA